MNDVSADTVSAALYAFTQFAFTNSGSVPQAPLEQAAADIVFSRLATGYRLTVKEVLSLPGRQQRAMYEVLTQYLIFLTMNPSLSFPDGFMDDTDDVTLGPPMLAYFSTHLWPFPQQLPWLASR